MIIKWMRCQNFKTFVDKRIDFNERVTWIKGMNADGKTTVATAYLWTFFNVDYDLANNPEVRRKVNGVSVDDVDVSVEICVDMDGIDTTFKKVQKRKFKKDSMEYSDDNSYFVNDVPRTLKEFNSRISDDIKIMMMCSHINVFISKKPDEVRKYLFSKIDSISDVDIARENPKFGKLVSLLEHYSTEELSAMNKKSKADSVKMKPIIEGQIKEVERNIALASEIGLAELELNRNSIKQRISDVESKISDISKLSEEQDNIQQEILKIQFDMNSLQTEANIELDKERSDLRQKINELDNSLKITVQEKQMNMAKADRILKEIENDNEEITVQRAKWKEISSAECYDKELTCQFCGQPLPANEQDRIRTDFENKKKESLDRITSHGLELKERIENNCKNHENIIRLIDTQDKLIDELNVQIKDCESQLSGIPNKVDISETEKYKKLYARLQELNEKTVQNVSVDRNTMIDELSRLQNELLECEKQIAKADTSSHEERLEELRNQMVTLEQNVTNAQEILDLLDELDKSKNGILSDGINKLFKTIKWRLFSYNKSGTYSNTCIPEIDGMSILTTDTNKAKRFIGKLDICNSIQKLEKINVPIFLDDVESLDSESTLKALELVDCQVILLKVTDDEELKIEG